MVQLCFVGKVCGALHTIRLAHAQEQEGSGDLDTASKRVYVAVHIPNCNNAICLRENGRNVHVYLLRMSCSQLVTQQ